MRSFSVGFYLVILLLLVLLALSSRKEELCTEEPLGVLLRIFQRMAVRLLRLVPAGRGVRFGNRAVLYELSLLSPFVPKRTLALRYRARRLRELLLFLAAADVLALAVATAAPAEGILPEGLFIRRAGQGEEAREIRVTEETYGTFSFVVEPRQYTAEEAEALAGEVIPLLPEILRGENPSLSEVREDLAVPKEIAGYPFVLTWESSKPDVLDAKGRTHPEMLSPGEQTEVELTATLSCGGWKKEACFPMTVYGKTQSAAEQRKEQIYAEILKEEAKDPTGEGFYLPQALPGSGEALRWGGEEGRQSMPVFFLVMAAGFINFLLTGSVVHKDTEKRERELMREYPHLISRMVLYLGAGMSVRNLFFKMASDYREEVRKGHGKRYAMEEIVYTCRELDSGISETEAYAALGKRCRSRQYTKLCSLLSQNVKKGNRALLEALTEEAEASFEERKRLAGRLGEEAGTKLLFPMILMLGVTLTMIMIPAYLGLSL